MPNVGVPNVGVEKHRSGQTSEWTLLLSKTCPENVRISLYYNYTLSWIFKCLSVVVAVAIAVAVTMAIAVVLVVTVAVAVAKAVAVTTASAAN